MYELNFRRRGWTRGLPVLLADGFLWYFPRIDFALMAATSGLQTKMARSFTLARDTRDEENETREKIKIAQYHAHMADLAVHLLKLNYELTEPQWKQAIAFTDMREVIAFSEQTSLIFFATSEVWMPFLATSGVEGREVLQLN